MVFMDHHLHAWLTCNYLQDRQQRVYVLAQCLLWMGQDHPWCPTRLSPGAATVLSPHQQPPFLHSELQDPHVCWWHFDPFVHQFFICCGDRAFIAKNLNAVNANKLKLNSAKAFLMGSGIGTRQQSVCAQRANLIVDDREQVSTTKYLVVKIWQPSVLGRTYWLRSMQQIICYQANNATPPKCNGNAL